MSNEEHFIGKVAQKAVIDRGDGTVLITRDERDPDTWELPGGRLNVGEDPKAGVAREVLEELGIEIVVHEPVYAEQFFHERDGMNALLIAWAARLADPSVEVRPRGGEVAELAWIGKNELDARPLFPEYRGALTSYFMRL